MTTTMTTTTMTMTMPTATMPATMPATAPAERAPLPEQTYREWSKRAPGWRLPHMAILCAKEVARHGVARHIPGCNRLSKMPRADSPYPEEAEDALRLQIWALALSGVGCAPCPDEVVQFLDRTMHGWQAHALQQLQQQAAR
jgi:hypothetical protein